MNNEFTEDIQVVLSGGSITQDAGRTATGRPFSRTSGCNLVGPDHKPKAQVYGRRVPPPRQNSPVSTSQQKAVACLPFAECMRDHRSACSTSEEGSQPTIKPVSWPEKGVNGAGKAKRGSLRGFKITTRATECGVPRTRCSALRELAMTEIETTCEIFVLSGPDGPTSAGKNGRYPGSVNMAWTAKGQDWAASTWATNEVCCAHAASSPHIFRAQRGRLELGVGDENLRAQPGRLELGVGDENLRIGLQSTWATNEVCWHSPGDSNWAWAMKG
ncbi:hypothetical protein C8J57DRAFT_1464175 [Mycena rebaudengoi]|nr:hypothetical protein C8J57DRAFT_1464175 [Mycena rebaudengoi]